MPVENTEQARESKLPVDHFCFFVIFYRLTVHVHSVLSRILISQTLNIAFTKIPKTQTKGISCNISKTSASVSSGFPNTRKQMKARDRRPSVFIVFEFLK